MSKEMSGFTCGICNEEIPEDELAEGTVTSPDGQEIHGYFHTIDGEVHRSKDWTITLDEEEE